jgi:hypothetical protein
MLCLPFDLLHQRQFLLFLLAILLLQAAAFFPANSDSVKASVASVFGDSGSRVCVMDWVNLMLLCLFCGFFRRRFEAIPTSLSGFFACSALNPGGGPAGGPPLVCVSVETPRRGINMANAGI